MWMLKANIFETQYEREQNDLFVNFHFDPVVKVFTYHYLYTMSHFLADIGNLQYKSRWTSYCAVNTVTRSCFLGGYMGLFLGLSLFSIVEIAEKRIQSMRNQSTETSIDEEENQDAHKMI